MRTLSLALVLMVSANAQAQVAGTNLWGGTPRQLNFTPIDTSKAVGATNLSKAFKTPNTSSSPLNLTNMFRSVSLPAFPPKTPQVSVMPQTQNVFQPNPIKGGVNMFAPAKK